MSIQHYRMRNTDCRLRQNLYYVVEIGCILNKSSGKKNISFLNARAQIYHLKKSNRKAINRNWSNQKANPALKTKVGNK